MDFNDPIIKEIILEKILNKGEVGYRKSFKDVEMKSLFDFLSIDENTNGEIFQKTLYDFLLEPTNEEKKCRNPKCNNEANFDRFQYQGKPFGYRPYCSKQCSSIAEPRGFSSKDHKKKILDDAKSKKDQRDKETEEAISSGTAICYYCGAPAVARGGKNDVYRCQIRVQDCPDVDKRKNQNISDASKGVSRKETAELLVTELERKCDYGCGGIAFYKLNGKEGEKFSCNVAYQACLGARKHRSNIMIKKYQDPILKKQLIDRLNVTNLSKYGYAWPAQFDDHRLKVAATLEKMYGSGITHNNLKPGYKEINDRRLISSSYVNKNYTWPSGKIGTIQGYENIALDQLLNIYSEEDILIGEEVPRITYYMFEQEKHYYPDIFIPKENLILEVKSPYTYINDLEKNKLKEQYTKDAGYEFIWLIYESKKGKLLNLYELTLEQIEEEALIEERFIEELLGV